MPNVIRFDAFEVDLRAGQLRKHGTRIRLRDQSFQVLALLLQHPGTVVAREELRRLLWHDDVFVDFDNNLNIVVGRLREALNDSAERPRFIETLPKHGYRFVAPVIQPEQSGDAGPIQRARIVVLPFVNLSGETDHDYFSDAMTNEIITALASLATGRLAVVARTTSMRYKSSHKDAAHIGRELRVDWVVEGAVRHTDGRASVNVQLVRGRDQTHLFARKYEAAVDNAFDLPAHIVQDLVAHLPGMCDEHMVAPLIGPGPPNRAKTLAAYKEFLEGRRIVDTGRPWKILVAKEHMEKALALDPEFADAHDMLAENYWYLGYVGYLPPKQAFAAGIMHAVRALEIDAGRAETHALLGQFHKIREYNWVEVEREMTLALRLNPNSPIVRTRNAVSSLMPRGRVREAADELERALEIDPLSLLARGWLGIMLVLDRRFGRGIEEARKVLDLDPDSFFGHFVLGACFAYQGKFDEAIAEHRKTVELLGDCGGTVGWLGLTLAIAGRNVEAHDLLARLEEKRTTEYVPASSLAWTHLGLREVDAAFEWMDRAVEECDQYLMPIKTYGFLDPIRSDPRYKGLLRKMNLESV